MTAAGLQDRVKQFAYRVAPLYAVIPSEIGPGIAKRLLRTSGKTAQNKKEMTIGIKQP